MWSHKYQWHVKKSWFNGTKKYINCEPLTRVKSEEIFKKERKKLQSVQQFAVKYFKIQAENKVFCMSLCWTIRYLITKKKIYRNIEHRLSCDCKYPNQAELLIEKKLFV